MFNKTLIAAFAAAAALSFANVAKADTLATVKSLGSIYLSNTQAVAVSVSATAYTFTDPTQAPLVNGRVFITGSSTAYSFNFGAPVASMTIDQEPIRGIVRTVAHLTTGLFVFADLNTRQRTIATANVDVIQTGAGKPGMVCFHIHDAVTGATLAKSCDSVGNLINLPLTSGLTTIQAP